MLRPCVAQLGGNKGSVADGWSARLQKGPVAARDAPGARGRREAAAGPWVGPWRAGELSRCDAPESADLYRACKKQTSTPPRCARPTPDACPSISPAAPYFQKGEWNVSLKALFLYRPPFVASAPQIRMTLGASETVGQAATYDERNGVDKIVLLG